MEKLGFINSFIFTLLALLHLYWATGGKWALDNATPTNEEGEKVLNPKTMDCIIVALGLLLFALFYLILGGFKFIELPTWVIRYAGWGISLIFLARAMGDFNYVGFFKKYKTSNFAVFDSKYYSPLCLLIGVIGLAVQIYI